MYNHQLDIFDAIGKLTVHRNMEGQMKQHLRSGTQNIQTSALLEKTEPLHRHLRNQKYHQPPRSKPTLNQHQQEHQMTRQLNQHLLRRVVNQRNESDMKAKRPRKGRNESERKKRRRRRGRRRRAKMRIVSKVKRSLQIIENAYYDWADIVGPCGFRMSLCWIVWILKDVENHSALGRFVTHV